jgi:hypothetical protein
MLETLYALIILSYFLLNIYSLIRQSSLSFEKEIEAD